jgi:hypothetical protein
MKNLLLLFLTFFVTVVCFGQNRSTLKVAGNCSMCKKNIETAAKIAGAINAYWDKNTKVLKFTFDETKTSPEKLELAIANAGYDTEHQTATNEAYSKLDECCQYKKKKKS